LIRRHGPRFCRRHGPGVIFRCFPPRLGQISMCALPTSRPGSVDLLCRLQGPTSRPRRCKSFSHRLSPLDCAGWPESITDQPHALRRPFPGKLADLRALSADKAYTTMFEFFWLIRHLG
jgi:hypothetical protein